MRIIMKTQLFDKTVIKFLAVGVVNTLVGCGTMFLLYNLAHCSYWVSSAANYVVGGIVSFFLNKYFTFQSKTWEWSQVWKFAVNVTVCYLCPQCWTPSVEDVYQVVKRFHIKFTGTLPEQAGTILLLTQNLNVV